MTFNGKAQSAEAKRITFSKTKFPTPYPDFLEIQLKSFQEFFQLETTPENRMNGEGWDKRGEKNLREGDGLERKIKRRK